MDSQCSAILTRIVNTAMPHEALIRLLQDCHACSTARRVDRICMRFGSQDAKNGMCTPCDPTILHNQPHLLSLTSGHKYCYGVPPKARANATCADCDGIQEIHAAPRHSVHSCVRGQSPCKEAARSGTHMRHDGH